MRQWLPDARESVDLIYLDPPFNSNANYNILFGKGNGVSAQMRGFTDTWKWSEAAAERVASIEKATANPIHDATVAFRQLLGESGMLAYLTYMGERLAVMRDLLKPTGSIYLHCDPTASHYLKTLMDSIFGERNFRNEIVWRRVHALKGTRSRARTLGSVNDRILFYSASKQTHVNIPKYDALDEVRHQFKYEDDRGAYRTHRLVAGAGMHKSPVYEWNGLNPPYGWHYSKENMDRMEAEGRIHYNSKGTPYRKEYLDEYEGRDVSDVWLDISIALGNERLGYPTQKPLKLLERIILASSNEGDLVLDPFCGCGTTIVAAHNLERRWTGIDISPIAIDLINTQRLRPLGIETRAHGIPQDLAGARRLASDQPFKFEEWAVTRIDGLVPNEHKVGDSGIDGRGKVLARPDTHDSDLVLAQATGTRGFSLGKFRDFLHVVERERAAAGVYITLERGGSDTALAEARAKGEIIVGASRYPRVQVWSIADYFDGRFPQLPTLADPYTGKPVEPRIL